VEKTDKRTKWLKLLSFNGLVCPSKLPSVCPSFCPYFGWKLSVVAGRLSSIPSLIPVYLCGGVDKRTDGQKWLKLLSLKGLACPF
jgi:hypothetical protein